MQQVQVQVLRDSMFFHVCKNSRFSYASENQEEAYLGRQFDMSNRVWGLQIMSFLLLHIGHAVCSCCESASRCLLLCTFLWVENTFLFEGRSRAGGVAQRVECLPSTHEALGSTPGSA